MSKIPEHVAPAEIYYDGHNAQKYETNSRIQAIQKEITRKCFDLLELQSPGLILDIGCGTGISGGVLSENNCEWIGIDISKDMLNICQSKGESLDQIRSDAGEGLTFKPGIFDGVISVSAIQWLFQSYNSSHIPKKRIRTFFTSLYSVVKPSTKCVLQFYLKNKKDIEILKNEATRAGFYGGIHIEKPNTKNVKQYLILQNYISEHKKKVKKITKKNKKR
ncbi:putative methyltransferase BUD23 [Vairimorpha necatrix]|uniref:Methyltransferase BUD23 n=1 Tax=Vairimorpha necatrix TaxID=6039 RepID=A0AAX4JCI6_9MICR